ncbi:hypothetical protein Dimus_032088, partial [Dionaea muscipula]
MAVEEAQSAIINELAANKHLTRPCTNLQNSINQQQLIQHDCSPLIRPMKTVAACSPLRSNPSALKRKEQNAREGRGSRSTRGIHSTRGDSGDQRAVEPASTDEHARARDRSRLLFDSAVVGSIKE